MLDYRLYQTGPKSYAAKIIKEAEEGGREQLLARIEGYKSKRSAQGGAMRLLALFKREEET